MTDNLSLPALKRDLRIAALAKRRSVHAVLAGAAGIRLAERFLGHFALPPDQVVATYWPIGDEVDMRPLLDRLVETGCIAALPVVVEKGQALLFRRWYPDLPLADGAYGTRHPPDSAPAVAPDVLVLPLLAFDRHGGRLGYGGGYYDRTVAALRRQRPITVVGAAYAAQEIPAVPHDEHDQRLDWIVTEEALLEAV